MTLDETIDKIDEFECVYNIHQCKAGWGFTLVSPVPMTVRRNDWHDHLYTPFYRNSIAVSAKDTLNYLKEKYGDVV